MEFLSRTFQSRPPGKSVNWWSLSIMQYALISNLLARSFLFVPSDSKVALTMWRGGSSNLVIMQ